MLRFILREELHLGWTIFAGDYIQIAVDFTSIDYLLLKRPSLLPALASGMTGTLMLIMFLLIALSMKLASSRVSTIEALMISVVNFCLLLLMSILQVPIIVLIVLCLSSVVRSDFGMNFTTTAELGLVGVLLVLMFIPLQLYGLICFRDTNPFSDAFHTS